MAKIELEKTERTWRIEIYLEKGKDPLITIHRETLYEDVDGNIISKNTRPVIIHKSLDVIKDRQKGPVKISEIVDHLVSLADDLNAEETTP